MTPVLIAHLLPRDLVDDFSRWVGGTTLPRSALRQVDARRFSFCPTGMRCSMQTTAPKPAWILGVVRMATSAQTEIRDGAGGFGGRKWAQNRRVCIRISPGAPPALGLPGPRKRPEQVWPDASGGGREDQTSDLRTWHMPIGWTPRLPPGAWVAHSINGPHNRVALTDYWLLCLLSASGRQCHQGTVVPSSLYFDRQ